MLHKPIVFDITPFTLLDYPDKTACIIWFVGCNMRCLYCYNPNIVFGKGSMSLADALHFIKSRKGLLDGVVLSGGECTLHHELIAFAQEVKKLGMLVKVDTNGGQPEKILALINHQLVDYISLDFKAPRDKFNAITQSKLQGRFEKTLAILLKSSISFEVRTTVHSALLSIEDIYRMADYLQNAGYSGKYFVQNFLDAETVGCISQSHQRINKITSQNSSLEIVVRS